MPEPGLYYAYVAGYIILFPWAAAWGVLAALETQPSDHADSAPGSMRLGARVRRARKKPKWAWLLACQDGFFTFIIFISVLYLWINLAIAVLHPLPAGTAKPGTLALIQDVIMHSIATLPNLLVHQGVSYLFAGIPTTALAFYAARCVRKRQASRHKEAL